MRRLQNTLFNIRRATEAVKASATAIAPTIKEVAKDGLQSAKDGWNGQQAEIPKKATKEKPVKSESFELKFTDKS